MSHNQLVGGAMGGGSAPSSPAPSHVALQLEDTLDNYPHRYVRVSDFLFYTFLSLTQESTVLKNCVKRKKLKVK